MSKEAIVIEDLLKFKYPSGLMYNPAGDLLALTVAEADMAKNGYQRNVFLVQDGACHQLTATLSASAILWDNDEELIINRSTGETKGMTELFRINVHGGEAVPWMVLPFALGNLKKVREGLYIASGLIDADDPDAYLDSEEVRREKQAKAEEEKDYQIVDEIPYWYNGKGFTNGKRTALFRIEIGEKTVIRRLSEPYTDCKDFTLAGETVYFTFTSWERCSVVTTNVGSYDCAADTMTMLYDKGDRMISNLFVREGQLYGEVSDMKTYGVNETGKLCAIHADGFTVMAEPDRSLHNTAATDTTLGGGKSSRAVGENWYTLAAECDHIEVWKYDHDFRKTVLFDKPGFITVMDAAKEKIAFVYSDPTHLCEVYEMNPDGTECHKVSGFNDAVLEGKYVADPQEMTYTFDGQELNGWVLLPEGFDPEKKYPAVLDIHGGPRAIYSTGYFHEMQVWCAKGYVVFFTNIRGSDGRGDRFADIRERFGEVDYDNLMTFTDAVLAAYPNIDETRLCETGGSYGGFMSNWIIGHTDRFCAAVSQRSIANWTTKLFISDIGLWYNAEQQGAKDVFDDADKLWMHSPLKYAKGAKTPTLFIHSDQDYRCPLPEGMQMMQALAYQNVETRMCIFHGENHELSRGGKPTHRIRRLKEITDWFDKHTK